MSRYEREFDADWDTLGKDEATDRAYAIGVAERLGEYNREELEAIYAEMGSAYHRSMVELAYDEGRNEAKAAAESGTDSADAVWAELVEGETTFVEPDDVPTGGRDGLPKALEPTELLDRQSVDSTEAVDRPDFLER
ncbi:MULTISPECIES: hypothetical protein [Haloarcula]|uniref:Uncharacterized protein n=1 Tax=Haloarcula pellucida TaxID=1427151 RepID=A0A830GQW6_9EURY|nr:MULTISPECIES: hypothetical protein [Halomicroarcula]MBX0349227.1 hypothetical protein [Halomicroarcula pellucida]MDS0279182.1 hypothetical protein [Halomicroarcula sp. S1AR25-4]QIO21542.1 hypothetical protein G9465_03915 [Haloarcula sp. JP-L23]GGN99600.1 hypothetical protein GCM10009030_31340 [Halomicroarcula pellucida]